MPQSDEVTFLVTVQHVSRSKSECPKVRRDHTKCFPNRTVLYYAAFNLSTEFGIVTLACNIGEYSSFKDICKRKQERTPHEGRLAIAFDSAESSAFDAGKIVNKQARSPRISLIAMSYTNHRKVKRASILALIQIREESLFLQAGISISSRKS